MKLEFRIVQSMLHKVSKHRTGNKPFRLDIQHDDNNNNNNFSISPTQTASTKSKSNKLSTLNKNRRGTVFGVFVTCVSLVALVFFAISPHSKVEKVMEMNSSMRSQRMADGTNDMMMVHVSSKNGMSWCSRRTEERENETTTTGTSGIEKISDSSISSYVYFNKLRFELYNSMVEETRKKGIVALKNGEASTQKLSNND